MNIQNKNYLQKQLEKMSRMNKNQICSELKKNREKYNIELDLKYLKTKGIDLNKPISDFQNSCIRNIFEIYTSNKTYR